MNYIFTILFTRYETKLDVIRLILNALVTVAGLGYLYYIFHVCGTITVVNAIAIYATWLILLFAVIYGMYMVHGAFEETDKPIK